MAHKQIFYYNTTSYQSGYTNKIEFNAEALSNDMQDTNIQGNKLYLEFSSPNGSPMERIIEIDSVAFDDGTFWEAEYQTEFTPDSPYESGNANNYIATISLDFTNWYTNGYCRIDLEDEIRDHNITIQMYYESISDDDEEDIDSSTAPSGTITLEQPLDDVMLTGSITYGSDWVLDGDTLYKDGVSIVHDELGGYLTNLSSISVNMAALLNEYGNGEYYVELRFTNDISGDSTVISSNRYNYYSPTAITPMRGTLTLSDDLILTLNIFDKPDGWNAAESVIHTPVRDIYDTLLDYNTPTAVVDLKDNLLNNEIDTLDEIVSGQYSASITYFYGDEEATYTVTSNTVTYTAYIEPSCADLKVTCTSDGKYIVTGTLEVGSHNIEDMAIEDPLCGNDVDETCFYDYTASVQSFKDALAEGIDLSNIVSVLGGGEYYVNFAILDDSASNPNPDSKASWKFETSFTVQNNSKIELHFDATTGTITGKVTLTDDGYTLEDVGSIRKCKSGNTIDLQNDEYITEVLYFTDFSNITAINSALATGITASSEHPSILAAIEENGTGYYYVDWYLINNDTYNDKTFTSEPSYYEAQNDDEHIEPSGSLTVITSNGIYTLSGSIDAGSHTKLTVEDYINISSSDGSIDIVLDDVDIETGTPAYPTLSINIDITKYLEGHPSDTYTASISVIDNPEDLSYHDEEYGDTFSTTFEYVGEDSEVPSMTLVLDVVNGKVTGSVSSLGEGYTEDEGSIYKCSNGSTINKQNDTWIGAIFTDSKYWTDNAADLDSLLKVGTTSIMTDNGTTSISEALAENGTGYYYVCWYITRDEGTSSSDGYGFQYSPVVYYEAQNDDEDYIEPSGSLTVTNNNGTYMLSGSIDAGSHTELTVEDYITISLSDGSVDIVLDDVGIETGTSASPSLSINIDITDYLSGYPNGTYIASISLIDETDSNPNPDGEYSWTFDTSFTIADDEEPSEESSISLQLNVDTGTITGSINLGDDGYELEDTGLIYKCKTGSTIDPADSMDATDDIWVGEVFNFSDYADIDTINNALSAGITQDIDGVSILDLISKSGTGYYYVRWYLINPNNTNDSRYFYSPVSYYKAEEPYQPKLNFINPTLKSLWQRLVNATDKLCGVSSSGSWQVILTSGEKDSNCYPYVEGNMLYSNGDPWKMEEVDQGTVWSFDPSEPLDISGFNTSGNYHIYSPMGATGDYRLVYQADTSSARSVGMKPIHDALLNHFGISHNTTPITPGDYMKGIAVAARYYSNGNIIDTTSTNSLSEIVTMLEGGVVTAAKCSECNIAFNSDESFITRNSTDGCTYYYHYNCAKKVGTVDPMTHCNYCGANLTVFEEHEYGDLCSECYSSVYPECPECGDTSTTIYYEYLNENQHTAIKKCSNCGHYISSYDESHYDAYEPTCICGADPCPEHGGYWTTSKLCPSCNNGTVECPGCNEYFPANELVDGYCSSCRGYKCPVCSEWYSSESSAMSCTMTGDCPGNNPGWGHVCEHCGGDHYESDCPNYCSYCKKAYCDCVTSWCSQEERDTKWHCVDTTSDQYACNSCGWIKTII